MFRIMMVVMLLLLSGCQINPYTFSPHWTSTNWYEAGREDGLSGINAKSEDDLADDWNDKKVDRVSYMKGYNEGLSHICQEKLLYGWGMNGKIYPDGCDSRENARELRASWQKGLDDGSRNSRLN